MAMPRKGTRRIVIDGVPFRWGGREGSYTVQHADTPRAVLRLTVAGSWTRPPLMPGEVAALIRQALGQGWQPTQPGPGIWLPVPPPPPHLQENAPQQSEVDWRASTNPFDLLRLFDPDVNERRTLLLTVAVFRRLWEGLPPPAREWIRCVEKVVEGEDTKTDINDAAIFSPVREAMSTALFSLSRAVQAEQHLALAIADTMWNYPPPQPFTPEVGAPVAHLVRDIFGNPSGEPLLKRSGLSLLLRTMAKTIYTEQAFADLPILADALEEADCASADILAHLREPGPHVRGCWALDMVLHEER